MNKFLYLILLALSISFTFTQLSIAGCNEGPPNTFTCTDAPPNPDTNGVQQNANANNQTVNVLQDAGIDTFNGNGLDCIITGDGNDNITLTGATLDCELDSVNPWDGINTVNITDSSLTSRSDVIDAFNGTNTINIQGSSLICAGNNTGCDGLNMSGGNDDVTIVESIVNGLGFAVRMGNGDDILRLGTGADMRGVIQCGFGNDSDTLIFSMEVPANQLASLSAEIAALNADDSITINGLFYEWEDCDEIVNQLVGVASSVPTLSEWGLIAMAGVLGIIGLLTIRRRKVTA